MPPTSAQAAAPEVLDLERDEVVVRQMRSSREHWEVCVGGEQSLVRKKVHGLILRINHDKEERRVLAAPQGPFTNIPVLWSLPSQAALVVPPHI